MTVQYVLLIFFMSACATETKQVNTLLKSNEGLPSHYEISNAPFINQSVGYCGPATLTMAML